MRVLMAVGVVVLSCGCATKSYQDPGGARYTSRNLLMKTGISDFDMKVKGDDGVEKSLEVKRYNNDNLSVLESLVPAIYNAGFTAGQAAVDP